MENKRKQFKCKDEVKYKNWKNMDYIKLFTNLPNFNLNKQIVINDCYNPTLYKWDGYWIVSWISDESDSLLEVTGDTPEDAIKNAVRYIHKNYPNYYSDDYIDKLYKTSVLCDK